MRKQQRVWQDEHNLNQALPSLAETKPSSQVVRFIEYLKSNNVKTSGKAVDIGSGKGRNSAYLASLGYEVWGLEYIELAVKVANQLAKAKNLDSKIHFQEAEIDQQWSFDDNYFDIAVDCFSSIDIETLKGREICRDEMYRTIRPGGYAMVSVVSANDEWESKSIAGHPGPEPNSSIWPQNGKFQKDYDISELKTFFGKFEIVEIKEISKPALKLGIKGTATNIWAILRKF